LHFHKDKKESWQVLSRKFEVFWYNTEDSTVNVESLGEGNA